MKNKIRFGLTLVALCTLIFAVVWWFQTPHAIKPIASTTVRTTQPAAPVGPHLVPVKPKLQATPAPLFMPPPVHRESNDSLAVGELLADTFLDNQAVMAGLSKMVLDTDRPIEERSEALGHLLNLSVEDRTAVILPLIGDARLTDGLCEHILNDSLNDDLAWQADASLAALTHRKGKALKDRAREHLAFLTDEEHGDNLAAWAKATATAKGKWAESGQ